MSGYKHRLIGTDLAFRPSLLSFSCKQLAAKILQMCLNHVMLAATEVQNTFILKKNLSNDEDSLTNQKISAKVCCCLVAKLCPTLCNLTDCSLLGSSVFGILQARILEWVAISFPRVSSQPKNQTRILHWQADSLPLAPYGALSSHKVC